jgi:chemotaxis protein methyltransferase CheR
MSVVLQPADLSRFRTLVSQRMGLLFEDDKLDYLAEVLRERLEASGGDRTDAYLERLSAGAPEEVRALARRLTIGETYFFRYLDHFRAFAEVVLPDRARYEADRRQLRILSAGCASGEEAYTLAILVREHLPNASSWDVQIRGIDINPQAIEKATLARYSVWSLRETPPEMRERYLRPQGRDFQLEERVRSAVSFEERNLLDDDASFWQPDSFDVVFCRNVTMYFTPEVIRSVVARITQSLTVGGFLFLGHAETLRGVSQDHHLCHTNNTFYYQRRDADRRIGSAALEDAEVHAASAPLPSLSVARGLDDPSWVDVIQGASDRIAKLSQGPRPSPSAPPASPGLAATSRPEWDLRPAVEMLRQERFADAMVLLQALPVGSQTDNDTQLLRAVLLTNGGKLTEAESVCQQILSKDELHAGAHYLVALCREHAGDRRAAVEHDQAATYLDGGFAMPHLHLGLLARRSGDPERARTELSRALTLLAREDASRILLYGGGFNREALVELCRGELRTCGGES